MKESVGNLEYPVHVYVFFVDFDTRNKNNRMRFLSHNLSGRFALLLLNHDLEDSLMHSNGDIHIVSDRICSHNIKSCKEQSL